MIDSVKALKAVVRHAVELEGDYYDIAPTLAALSACGDIALIPRLHKELDRFLDEANFYGRDLVAGILAGIQGMAALPTLLCASSRDLGDDQDSLSAEIIELLKADQETARLTVLELATSDTPELRRTALWALGFVAQARDFELLAAAAADHDPQTRATAIGSMPDPADDDRAFQVLVQALRDPHDDVRVSAISRLGYTGRPDAATALTALAADRAPRVRSMVAYALGRLGNDTATPTLLLLCHDPDPHVRDSARVALGSVGGPAAVDALLALAADTDPRVRARAAGALARAVNSDPRVPQHLVSLAQDPAADVRAAVISGLSGAGGEPARWTSFVAGLANDPAPAVRLRVAVAARRLAPGAAQDILRRYARDPDERVRRVAGVELERLTNPAVR